MESEDEGWDEDEEQVSDEDDEVSDEHDEVSDEVSDEDEERVQATYCLPWPTWRRASVGPYYAHTVTALAVFPRRPLAGRGWPSDVWRRMAGAAPARYSGGAASSSRAPSSASSAALGAYEHEGADDDDEEEEEDEYADFGDFGELLREGASTSSQQHAQPREAAMAALDRRVHLGEITLSNRAANDVRRGELKQHGEARIQGRDDRATTEQVMDPRTRLVLFKLLSRGAIEEINGCISTGKEANVYHATCAGGPDLAVKVFKTSILVFKDRDKYVSGEHRFSGGYGKGNPRKMVKLWAEKEMRNLKRLHSAGIPCPEPRLLRSHVLLMDFVGKDGWPAPRLKDAQVTEQRARSAYVQCLKILRRMFQLCRLVHGDFSEYNLLMMDGQIFVIDVSQSVEMDHPRALEFLRLDIENTNIFFSKKGLETMSLTQGFSFVVDPSFGCTDDAMDAQLEHIESAMDRAQQPVDTVAQAVFMHSFIPTRLNQVLDIEREDERVAKDQDRQLTHILTGMKLPEGAEAGTDADAGADTDAGAAAVAAAASPLPPRATAPASAAPGSVDVGVKEEADGEDELEDQDEADEDETEEDDDDKSTNSSESDGEGGRRRKKRDEFFTLKNADKDERKAHKKKLKEENREKRKTKTPKHVKKRLSKLAKDKSKK